MSWNYRVCTKKDTNQERYFTILPVYYLDGIPNAWGLQHTAYAGENVGQLLADLKLRAKASELPILNLDKFPEIYEPKETELG